MSLTRERRSQLTATAKTLSAEGKSLRVIGAELGVSRTTIAKWLKPNPPSEPTSSKADQMAAALCQVRTPSERRNYLDDLDVFIAAFKKQAVDQTSTATERRLSAANGSEYSLAAYEMSAELLIMEMIASESS